jgi:hypothetical protein
MTTRTWEWAAIGAILLVAVFLLFVPPIIGVADQGDFMRMAGKVGLAPPSLSFNDRYICWVLQRWDRVPPVHDPFFQVGELPAWIAVHLSRGASFDIRWNGLVHLVFLLGIVLAICRGARKLPAVAYAVVGIGLILIGTDSEYISHFNSFYGESESFLAVLCFVAAGLMAATAARISWRHLLAITLAAAFLVASKAQNSVPGLVAAAWLIWLFKDKAAQRYASAAAAIALAGFTTWVIHTDTQPQFHIFHAIYDRILPQSMDPEKTLAELGLRPETIEWKGKLYWDVKIESADVFPGKVTYLKLLAYYLRHPIVDFRIAREALTLNNDVPYLGNYTKESGVPCATRTQAFAVYDRLRSQLASVWFVFPLLALNMAAVFLSRSRMAGLISTLAIMALISFPISGTFYDTDPRKHLLTFNLLFDVLLFADLAAAAVLLPRRANWKKYTAAVPLLLLLVLAVVQAASSSVLNLASGKAAAQSSTLSGYATTGAGGAVDGKTDGSFSAGSVTSTNRDTNAWWQVDLGASKATSSIVIWNRTDCCPSRLSDYWVFLSDTPFSPGDTPAMLQKRAGIWKSHQMEVPNPSTTIRTDAAKGRYVRVQLSGTDYLSLAEVQVFGQ